MQVIQKSGVVTRTTQKIYNLCVHQPNSPDHQFVPDIIFCLPECTGKDDCAGE